MQRANGQYQAVDDLDPAITSQLYDFWTVNVVAEHEWGARNDSGTNAGCGSLRLFFAIINDLQVSRHLFSLLTHSSALTPFFSPTSHRNSALRQGNVRARRSCQRSRRS